ncbi:hypothetical protein KEM48_000672 [Puccinia striiformis f. sp. tritici PST-130]|nr:hypothetical protein KEM48_000672 [Puccinia striiformis f. sp. tritici PST-130]
MHGYQINQNLESLDQLAGCLTQLPDPVPTENQVLIDVKTLSRPTPFPFIPGAELSGVISLNSPIPKGCPFVPGKTRVFGSTQGCYATKACVAWDQLIEIPPGLDFEHSAAIFVTYPTSYASLINRGKLKKGEWCLVHAAAGSRNRRRPNRKSGGSQSDRDGILARKLEFVRKYGGLTAQDYTLVYDDKPASSTSSTKKKSTMLEWQAQVLKITKGKGVDVVFDPVGLLNKSLKVAAWDCRLVVVGFAGKSPKLTKGDTLQISPIEAKPKTTSLAFMTVSLTAYRINTGGQIDKIPANLLLLKNAAVTESFGRGQIRPVLHTKIYNGLKELPEGLKDLGSRKVLAKAILRIEADPKSKL